MCRVTNVRRGGNCEDVKKQNRKGVGIMRGRSSLQRGRALHMAEQQTKVSCHSSLSLAKDAVSRGRRNGTGSWLWCRWTGGRRPSKRVGHKAVQRAGGYAVRA